MAMMTMLHLSYRSFWKVLMELNWFVERFSVPGQKASSHTRRRSEGAHSSLCSECKQYTRLHPVSVLIILNVCNSTSKQYIHVCYAVLPR